MFAAGWMDRMILLFLVGGSRVGGIAQLGEHLLCKQGVIGSIPIVSTTRVCFANAVKPPCPLTAAMVCVQTMRAVAGLGTVRSSKLADFGLYRGMSRIRFDHVPGQSVLGCVVMPFVSAAPVERSCCSLLL